MSFASALREPEFVAREFVRGEDAATLARDILSLNDEAFRAAFESSPITRAKLRGLQRNASVVLGIVGQESS